MNTPFVLKMMMVRISLAIHKPFSLTVPLDTLRVAFVKKTYTVDESVGAVNVCVNLTHPMRDIRHHTVNVYVIDDSSSIYIPASAPLASELSLILLY